MHITCHFYVTAFVTWKCSPSFNRKDNGKKTAKKYHNVTAPNSNGKPT